jgi:hypothetical protein
MKMRRVHEKRGGRILRAGKQEQARANPAFR